MKKFWIIKKAPRGGTVVSNSSNYRIYYTKQEAFNYCKGLAEGESGTYVVLELVGGFGQCAVTAIEIEDG